MKKDFTEIEKNLITAICSLYSIIPSYFEGGVFKGYVPKDARITLNGTYLSKLINSSNAVYIESKENVMILTILAQ